METDELRQAQSEQVRERKTRGSNWFPEAQLEYIKENSPSAFGCGE